MLKHLFEPLKIGSITLANRIMMSPMGVPAVDEEGHVTPAFVAYYAERARGKPGAITLPHIVVHPSGWALRGLMTAWDDSCIPELEKLVKALHEHDVKVGIELGHGGLQVTELDIVKGPSAVAPLASSRLTPNTPSAMTLDEIKECLEAFGKAAERCVKAGLDYLEVYAANGYLINEFLSPYFNRRNDEYGGSFENRTRFLLEAIRECRKRVGSKVTIGVRLNADDLMGSQGWSLEESCKLAPVLEKEGIDYISVSFGVYAKRHFIPPIYEPQGAYVYLAEEIKKRVSIPVAAVGRIKSPVMADKIIAEGKADLIIMGRALIADPELPEKARTGRIADIRPCLADILGCAETYARQACLAAWPSDVTCTVNPRVFREWVQSDSPGQKKSNPKKILVVGAGPAGLEAARRAAFAGHHVMLCESRGHIGGQLAWASKIPGRQEVGDLISWYERQLGNLGVEVRLNVTVNKDFVKQIGPDFLVVATGSVAEVPLGYISGLDNIVNIELMTVDELMEDERPAGDNVMVIGVDQIGVQVADYLAEQGKNVYLAGNASHFAEKMGSIDRAYLMDRVSQKGVKKNRKVTGIEIEPGDEVWLEDERGRERLPGIDTIIFADKRLPSKNLAEVSSGGGPEIFLIGDTKGTQGVDQGTILSAIASGYELGRRL